MPTASGDVLALGSPTASSAAQARRGRAGARRGVPDAGDDAARLDGRAPGRRQQSTARPGGTDEPHTYRATSRASSGRGGSGAGSPFVRARLGVATEMRRGARPGFADGGSCGRRLLIGSDGVHSVVRRVIDPSAPAPTSGVCSTRAATRAACARGESGHLRAHHRRHAFLGAWRPEARSGGPRTCPSAAGAVSEDLLSCAGKLAAPLLKLFAGDAGPAIELMGGRRGDARRPIHSLPPRRAGTAGGWSSWATPRTRRRPVLHRRFAGDRGRRRARDCLRELPDAGAAFPRFGRSAGRAWSGSSAGRRGRTPARPPDRSAA